MEIIYLGLTGYSQVLALQQSLFAKNTEAKLSNKDSQNYLILCEHEPVFTLGKSGKEENIVADRNHLDAEYYHIDRGGDITFHGPGQLVVYPILDLDTLGIGLAKYISNLEDVVISTLKEYSLRGQRLENAAGIWLRDIKGERKICAIGVKASRNITMHGLAMNVNTDLSYFDKIIPCGLPGKGVTSLKKELGREIDIESYKKLFIKTFLEQFKSSAFQHDSSTSP